MCVLVSFCNWILWITPSRLLAHLGLCRTAWRSHNKLLSSTCVSTIAFWSLALYVGGRTFVFTKRYTLWCVGMFSFENSPKYAIQCCSPNSFWDCIFKQRYSIATKIVLEIIAPSSKQPLIGVFATGCKLPKQRMGRPYILGRTLGYT